MLTFFMFGYCFSSLFFSFFFFFSSRSKTSFQGFSEQDLVLLDRRVPDGWRCEVVVKGMEGLRQGVPCPSKLHLIVDETGGVVERRELSAHCFVHPTRFQEVRSQSSNHNLRYIHKHHQGNAAEHKDTCKR